MVLLRSVLNILRNSDFRHEKCNDGCHKTMQNSTSGNQRITGVLMVPIDKGGTLVICHTEWPKFGFVEGCKIVFEAKKDPADCQSKMNNHTFRKCFLQLLSCLEEVCVIVTDNANYNLEQISMCPNLASRKYKIVKWLEHSSVVLLSSDVKIKLLQKVSSLTPIEKFISTNQLAFEQGHEIVNIPPYYWQYNELVWAQEKEYMAESNNAFKLVDTDHLTHEVTK